MSPDIFFWYKVYSNNWWASVIRQVIWDVHTSR